jgi:hypothetical protein
MKDNGVDGFYRMGSQLFLFQCKGAEELESHHSKLRKILVTLRNGIAHKDLAPNNLFLVGAKLHHLFICPTALPKDEEQEKANRRALARVLSCPKITSTVHTVVTACNLLKVLKCALRVLAKLLASIHQTYNLKLAFFQFVVTEHDWFKVHGPRPPRCQPKRLGAAFSKYMGVFTAH